MASYVYDNTGANLIVTVSDRNNRAVLIFEYNSSGQLVVAREPNGRRVEYTYQSGRLTRVRDPAGQWTTYEYDDQGRMTRKVDSGGRPTRIAYDAYGNVSQVVDRNGNGHFFTFDYNSAAGTRYAQIRSSSGMVKEVWYNEKGETIRVDINGRTVQTIAKDGINLIVTDEKGNVTRKDLDEWENITRITYPDGTAVNFEYEHTFNQITRLLDQKGTVHEYLYDTQGNLTQKVEAVGTAVERVSEYMYNGLGQLLTATSQGDAHTESASTFFTYDAAGNVASITDPMGNTNLFLQYDTMGNLLEKRDPRGYTWKYAYDDLGRLTSQTDPMTNTTAHAYDGANNRTNLVNACLKQFGFEYDDHNNLVKAIDPYGKTNLFQYNTDNLLTKTTDAEGKESSSFYDNEGRLLKTVDGAGNQIAYQYDESQNTPASSFIPATITYPTYSHHLYYDNMQRVVREEDDLGDGTNRTVAYVYDSAGNLISQTDSESNTTRFAYDVLNRLTNTIDSMGGVTKRSYDARGNLIALEDPNGGVTRWQYDRNNRLLKLVRPMGQVTSNSYDAAGNRTSMLDAKGQKITYEYDGLSRLVRTRHFTAADHANPVKTIEFTYDALGNLTSWRDGAMSATNTYDDVSRKLSETVSYGSFTLGYSNAYTANGLRKSFTGPDGIPYEYTYDDNNRLSSIAVPGQGQITWHAYQWNSPTHVTVPGGNAADYSYDPLMRVKSITAVDPGQLALMSRQYQYSSAGNITAKDTEHGDYAYQYDPMYRLAGASNPVMAAEAYQYDRLGNRTNSLATGGSWNYNLNNELLSNDSETFAYDDNGNMTSKTTATAVVHYIYDVADRLARVEDGSGGVMAEYGYDPFGRRLWKQVGGVRTYYFYSDQGLIGEYDANGMEIKTYGYKPYSVWSTDPLFQKVNGIYYWYQNDHLGTPQKIVDSSGRTVWSAVYDSFGNCNILVSEIENNLRLPGQYFDTETDLHYNWNRYYDPVEGRYLTTDPIHQGMNLYAYVSGNPINFVDPLGLCGNKEETELGGLSSPLGMAYVEDFLISVSRRTFHERSRHLSQR